jgi:hypothetical protein
METKKFAFQSEKKLISHLSETLKSKTKQKLNKPEQAKRKERGS